MKSFLLFLLLFFSIFALQAQDARLMSVADSLHRTFVSIDTHNDASLRFNFPDRSRGTGQVSFPLMKQGGLDVAFFAAYVAQGPCTDEGHLNAFENINSQLRGLHKYVEERSTEGEIAYTPQDMRRIKPTGRSAMVLGIENGYCIGTKLSNVKHFYDLGVRIITLCHNGNNVICDSSADTLLHNGLSSFGREVVQEMNRLGIVIDVSHASKTTTLEVVALSKDPVMASHSGIYALHSVPRNLSDAEMLAIAAKGGVIQVGIAGFFLSTLPRTEVTVKHVVDHIDYVVNLVGIDYVGIGSDFDGGGGVSDCANMGEMKNITVELLRRGYTAAAIAKIWGENTIRLVEQVQKSASDKR